MRHKLFHHFQYKILLSITVCIFCFTLLTSIIIASLLGEKIINKSEDIHLEYANAIYHNLSDSIKNIETISLHCMDNLFINQLMSASDPASDYTRQLSLKVQNQLDSYLASSPLNAYVQRFLVFNTNGILVTSSVDAQWNLIDKTQFFPEELIHEADKEFTPVYRIINSPAGSDHSAIVCLYPITIEPNGYIYIELSTKLISDQLKPYENTVPLVIAENHGDLLWSSSQEFHQSKTSFPWDRTNFERLNLSAADEISIGWSNYKINRIPVTPYDITIYTLTESSFLITDNQYILLLLLLILFTVLCMGFLVSHFISRYVSKPLTLLTAHIRQLTSSDQLEVNPEIEAYKDEIGEIGQVVNHLVLHINDLIARSEALFEEKKNMEINLLQQQINPHFLYNTLDSIRWMAIIQKNQGIEQITSSLINLLRNVTKGINEKITLREELVLASDYVKIQQLRYSEIFDFHQEIPDELLDCKIIKFSLQPLIENALLHGIEPKGIFGEIHLSATSDEHNLYITIQDNGIGMSEEEIESLNNSLKHNDTYFKNNVGIPNVNSRLKLIYGDSYGLSYSSLRDSYTKVTIHIPLEW